MKKYQPNQLIRTFDAPLDSTEVISSLSNIDTEIPSQIRYVGQKFYSTLEKRFYWFNKYNPSTEEWTYDLLKVFGKTVNCIVWNIRGTATYESNTYSYINYEGLVDFIQDHFLNMVDEDFGSNDALNAVTFKLLPLGVDITVTRIDDDNFDIELDLSERNIYLSYMNLNLDTWGEEVTSFLNESEAFALPIEANITYSKCIVGSTVLDGDDINNSRQFRTNYDYIVDYLCDITSVGNDFKFLPGRLYRDIKNTYICNGSTNTESSLVPISMNYDLQPVLVNKDLEISDWYTHIEQQALPFGAKETKNAISVSIAVEQDVVDCMLIIQDDFGHFNTAHLDFVNNGGTLYIKSRYALQNAKVLILYKRTPNSGISIDGTYPSEISDRQNIIPAITDAVHDGRRTYDEG